MKARKRQKGEFEGEVMSKEKEYWLYFPETQQFLVRKKETMGGKKRYRLAFVDNPSAEGKGTKISWTEEERRKLPSKIDYLVESVRRYEGERYHVKMEEE